MSVFRFNLIATASPMSHQAILDATDALAETGCTDASIRGHSLGMELMFERTADSHFLGDCRCRTGGLPSRTG